MVKIIFINDQIYVISKRFNLNFILLIICVQSFNYHHNNLIVVWDVIFIPIIKMKILILLY